jgi:2'-5' RNA ligase
MFGGGVPRRAMRVFVAIDLPGGVRAELVRLQSLLSVGRPVPAENLHLTLSFLGEQSEEDVEAAHHALSSVRSAPFSLELSGLDAFGAGTPQVIFAGVKPCEGLFQLERRVVHALRQARLDFEKRRFRPHVTVMRLPARLSVVEEARIGDDLARHSGFQATEFEVDGFCLYRSSLTPKIAVYDALAGYALVAPKEKGSGYLVD